MPIKPERRALYPANWAAISAFVRFACAGGVCDRCGRPHGAVVSCLPDGRWQHPQTGAWRNPRGRAVRGPDLVEAMTLRSSRVSLAAAHIDHNPRNNRLRNLRCLCQRCHLAQDHAYHRAQRRITYLLRRAIGDLFTGPYRRKEC